MSSRLFVPLLVASALAFACGPLSHSSAVPATDAAPADTTLRDVAAALDVAVGDEVEFALHVTNAGEKRMELNFASGQTHDVAVLDAAGREIWRWSSGRMFTQSVQNKLLGAGERASYRERWDPDGFTGSFTAVVTLASTNHPVQLRRGFTLE